MRRRILFVLPFPPQLRGRHGGSRATAALLRELAVRHCIAVMYLREASEDPIDPEIAALCDTVCAIKRPLGEDGLLFRLRRRVRLVRSLLGGVPIWAQALQVPDFSDALQMFVEDWRPEVVQCEYLVMGQYLGALGACPAPRILVVHEPGEKSVGRASKSPSPVLMRLDRLAWRKFERRLLREVQAVVVFTEEDRASIERHGVKVPIETIGIGLALPRRAADPAGVPPPTALFVGNYGHRPNADAASRLLNGIWPLVRDRHPEAVLALVGVNPPSELLAAASVGVQVTGVVADVQPFLESAAVFVAPVRQGGGMRVKVLEALAAGKAIVASPLAVAGLDVEDGHQVLVAQTDEDFARAISRVIDDEALRRALGEAARTWALVNLTVEKSSQKFERLYERTLKGEVNSHH